MSPASSKAAKPSASRAPTKDSCNSPRHSFRPKRYGRNAAPRGADDLDRHGEIAENLVLSGSMSGRLRAVMETEIDKGRTAEFDRGEAWLK